MKLVGFDAVSQRARKEAAPQSSGICSFHCLTMFPKQYLVEYSRLSRCLYINRYLEGQGDRNRLRKGSRVKISLDIHNTNDLIKRSEKSHSEDSYSI